MKEKHPVCEECKEPDCKVSLDGTCALIRSMESLQEIQKATDMDAIQIEIGKWGDETFEHSEGNPAYISNAIVNHMEKEMAELGEEIVYKDDGGWDVMTSSKIAEECADIFILMCSIAHINKFSIRKAVEEKMKVNRKREWGAADSDGVIEHVKEAK